MEIQYNDMFYRYDNNEWYWILSEEYQYKDTHFLKIIVTNEYILINLNKMLRELKLNRILNGC